MYARGTRLQAEGAPLVDVLMWECHLKWRGEPGRCKCAAWEEALRARGVASIYRDPYWFLPTRVGGGWQKLPEWKPTPTVVQSTAA